MTLKLSFLGAAGTVTGSCFVIETDEARIMVDCGMFQGSKTLKQLNYQPFRVPASTIDAVLLTHAHIDHSGLLPKLMLDGFRQRIYTTAATADLLGCMLPDSGHIQETEVEALNRRTARRGIRPVTPIYTAHDAERLLHQLWTVDYAQWQKVAKGIRARWWNAGHLLGSASIEVEVTDDNFSHPKRFLFSGDIGPDHKLLQPDPYAPEGFDIVVCEATYGDTERIDVSKESRLKALAEIVGKASQAGGALLIPSFAVERTQELVTDLASLIDTGAVPSFPIFVDSPLASKATNIFKRHAQDLDEGHALLKAFASPNLRVSETIEDSKAIARIRGFHVVIAASGMCDAGRIRHHLRNWLHRPDATVLLVGYQAKGSLGRFLQDGARAVRIQGDEILVRASIRTIESYSGHADASQLIKWVKDRLPIQQAIFLVHGETDALAALKERLSGEVAPQERILIPRLDDTFAIGSTSITITDQRSPPRLAATAVGELDWHNDLSQLMLELHQILDRSDSDFERRRIVNQLSQALKKEFG